MRRSIWVIPASTTLDTLTPEQQEAIAAVYSQFVLPMPGTVEHDGKILVDGITADSFDPSVMPGLGLDWECLYLCQWDLVSPEVTEIVPLDLDKFMNHVPDIVEHDENGAPIATHAPERKLAHNWAGWPRP